MTRRDYESKLPAWEIRVEGKTFIVYATDAISAEWTYRRYMLANGLEYGPYEAVLLTDGAEAGR